jgi:hypothetical protein
MDANDSTMIKEYYQQLKAEKKSELSKNQVIIAGFINFCANTYNLKLDKDNFDYIERVGIVARRKNLLKDICPSLPIDKDGFVSWSFLIEKLKNTNQMTGYISIDNFIAMAHHYFRRSMHPEKNWAPAFVDPFWQLKDENIDASIALDYDTVRINTEPFFYGELDTWFGAPFHNNIESISDGIVKLRPPLDLPTSYVNIFFNDAHSLDIKWTSKGKIKTFQSLEYKHKNIQIELDGIHYHPVRYMHAEYDIEKGKFRHFDGAVQHFTHEEYRHRIDGDFNFDNKSLAPIKTKYVKLFKFNGEFSVSHWVEFCSHYFTGNPLMYEYFNGNYPKYLIEKLSIIREKASKK